jgi:hypothetical protein
MAGLHWKITCVTDHSGKTLGWFWSQFTPDAESVKSCLFESFEECFEAAKMHGIPDEATDVEMLIACAGNERRH